MLKTFDHAFLLVELGLALNNFISQSLVQCF